MKVYPGVKEPKKTRSLAKTIGLSNIKTKHTYCLYKTGEKNSSPFGYPSKMFCGKGNIYGASQFDYIWIILIEDNGKWFKTSPIESCVKIDKGFKIETKNSYYELIKQEDIK